MKTNELSASLSHVAHLLVLISFYLSIRLPAEITLPHREYPLATIFTPANSYSAREVPFPGITPTNSSSNSPTTSRHGDTRPPSRPRPLFLEPGNIHEKVPHVAKKDPVAFNFFLEGVSLLAWDVAWVCRSQGSGAGSDAWEDVCNMGRNLWNLLISPPQSPALMRVLSTRDVQGRQKSGKESPIPALAKAKSVPKLGQFSHASAHSFLGASDGQEFLRGWKLSKFNMISDPLRAALIGEMNNAEWELLEEPEWDDGGEHFDGDEAVFIRTRAMDGHDYDDARSVMTATIRPSESAQQTEDLGPARAKGTSGWTKLKSRDK